MLRRCIELLCLAFWNFHSRYGKRTENKLVGTIENYPRFVTLVIEVACDNNSAKQELGISEVARDIGALFFGRARSTDLQDFRDKAGGWMVFVCARAGTTERQVVCERSFFC